MLNATVTQMDESKHTMKKKFIEELKDELLGMKKGNIPYIISQHERTPIVKIETIASIESYSHMGIMSLVSNIVSQSIAKYADTSIICSIGRHVSGTLIAGGMSLMLICMERTIT